jgi:hypothetical protein
MSPSDQLGAPNNEDIATSKDDSPFFKLPAELRLMVYRAVLVHEKPLCLRPYYLTPIDTSLLCANKAIHREAKHVFYQENVFTMTDLDGEETTGKLQHARPLVREVVIHLKMYRIDTDEFSLFTKALRHFRNLKIFKVVHHSSRSYSSQDIEDTRGQKSVIRGPCGTDALQYLPPGCEVVLEGDWTENARTMVKNRECLDAPTDKVSSS